MKPVNKLKFLSILACASISLNACTNSNSPDNTEIFPTNMIFATIPPSSSNSNTTSTPDITPIPEQIIKKSVYSSGVSVHDPSIVKTEDGTYYIFGSAMDAAKSTNLFMWKSFASGVNKSNTLFKGLFDSPAFDWVGLNSDGWYSVWAPDVFYNKAMKKWYIYFCTTSDWNTSSICFAVSDNIEGPYEYQASLIHSGFTSKDVSKTNVSEILGYDGADRKYWTSTDYNSDLWPNAIDPCVFYDTEGKLWMVYGSWSGGIFILELDEKTGLVIHPEDDAENGVDKYFGKHLLGRGHKSCEGPYIEYNPETEYYYLFVSYGGLASDGGYNIRYYRSKNPDGPYEDAAGKTWTDFTNNHSLYGVKLMGNYIFPSLSKAYVSPGHNSALYDDDGRMYLVYHTRFDDGAEFHQPRVHQLFANEDGWLVAAPFAFNEFTGEKEYIEPSGYPQDLIAGTYYVIDHGLDISVKIKEASTMTLNIDGTISDGANGNWSQNDGTYYANININGKEYKGVFFRQLDEAYQPVMTFTALAPDNTCIWGVKYLYGEQAEYNVH